MFKNSILIVNKNNEQRNQLTQYLSEEYEIYCTTNFEEITKLLRDGLIDILILNCETILEAKEINNIINSGKNEFINEELLIVYTIEEDVELEVELLKNGASEIIKKPFNDKVVQLQIKKLCNIKEKINKIKEERDDKLSVEEVRNLVDSDLEELKKSRNKIIVAMSILAESRDDSTGEHIFRMHKATSILARKYRELYPENMSENLMEEIILFSPLHDIGKVPIPDNILKNEGVFSEEEFSEMQSHAVLGGEILLKTQNTIGSDGGLLKVAIEIATFHHEKFDGSGYPFGLVGEEIPLPARIVALADVYDALSSPRRYKIGFSHEEVLDIILKGDGRVSPKNFDPKVIEAFRQSSEEFKEAFKEVYKDSENS